ncbi:protein LATERAL ROOT PRIMORDIUM 1-like [Tasmannia lanceolata]|uniref:protein LATERAL ROOT PRIMORDIUM 1-like n=1 Tax=Tasmannia lanceolata TaxID=3420 RepID=UPI004063FCD8
MGMGMGMGMVGLRDVLVVTQQQQNLHYHHHHHQQILPQHVINPNNNTPQTLGVIPLLTTTPCVAPQEENMINLWQNQNQNQNQTHQSIGYPKKPIDNLGTRGGADMYVAGVSSGTTCQDCGNQAKKDCTHRRCRTCCKSRGFDCTTHVKSTWVPAARRRERQLSVATGATGSSASISTKKPRLISSQTTSHTSTSNTTPPRSLDTGSSSQQDASFKGSLPGQVCAPAVFKCVRVTAIEGGEDEFAYQAMVKIGGHVFKGFLYDHGDDGKDGFPNISDLHLGANNGAPSSSPPVLDHPDVYGSSGPSGLLGGMPYGNQIN